LHYFVIFFTKFSPTGFAKSRTEVAVSAPGPAFDAPFDLTNYYPIFIYLVVVLGFAGTTLVLAQTIGPWRKTRVKLMPYESGMDPIGDARRHFDVKFYLIAILFLVFDVELLFLYPWAVIAYGEAPSAAPEWHGFAGFRNVIFWEVLVFLATLVVAYVYAWRKGVFRWR
jgi:NADH-quinone oxidoreductase subunit A